MSRAAQERVALAMAGLERNVTDAELAEALGTELAAARRILTDLEEQRLIGQVSEGVYTELEWPYSSFTGRAERALGRIREDVVALEEAVRRLAIAANVDPLAACPTK